MLGHAATLLAGVVFVAFGVAYIATGDIGGGALFVFVGAVFLLLFTRRVLVKREVGRFDVLLTVLLLAGFGAIGVEGAIHGGVLSAIAGVVCFSFALFFLFAWWRVGSASRNDDLQGQGHE